MNKDKKTTIYCGYTVCIEYSEKKLFNNNHQTYFTALTVQRIDP